MELSSYTKMSLLIFQNEKEKSARHKKLSTLIFKYDNGNIRRTDGCNGRRYFQAILTRFSKHFLRFCISQINALVCLIIGMSILKNSSIENSNRLSLWHTISRNQYYNLIKNHYQPLSHTFSQEETEKDVKTCKKEC